MEKEFIPYEQALALKELGFDEPCLGHYIDYTEPFTYDKIKGKLNLGFLGQCKSEPYDWNNTPKWGVKSTKYISSPFYQQAFRWFRVKHGLICIISMNEFHDRYKGLIKSCSSQLIIPIHLNATTTYEEAELECLKKLIEIIVKQNK